MLNRPFNIKGLALGAEATTKNNLNITNGEYVFQTYNEITEFINNNTNYKNSRKKNITTHVLCCCKGNQKTAYGYNWKFVNDGETRI